MNWPQQPPPQWSYPAPPPPPLPPDARIKKAVRAGQVFQDPHDAHRAALYAEGFLKNGADLSRAGILVGIILGLLATVLLEVLVNNVFAGIVPGSALIGLLIYILWFHAHKHKVEQSLAANRQVAGGWGR